MFEKSMAAKVMDEWDVIHRHGGRSEGAWASQEVEIKMRTKRRRKDRGCAKGIAVKYFATIPKDVQHLEDNAEAGGTESVRARDLWQDRWLGGIALCNANDL